MTAARDVAPLRADLPLLAGLALFVLVLHVPFLAGHGWHRDELYFLSCGLRPAAGYVDHPPLVPWIAGLVHAVAGPSRLALRVAPLLAGVALVWLVGLVVRELGGRRRAILLAGAATALAPVYLRTANVLAIPSFEPVFWTLALLLLLRQLRVGPGPGWLVFGLVAGLSLLNKHTTLLLGGGVLLALLATRHRAHLATRWPWLGGAVAALVFAPNLWWQVEHDWATWRFVQELSGRRIAHIPAAEFLLGQVLYAGPPALFVWGAGVVWGLRGGGDGRARALVLVWALTIGVLLLTGGKVYYATPVVAALFAAGAVAWERIAVRRPVLFRILLGLVVGVGLAFAPLGLPVLPLDRVDAYAAAATGGALENSHEVTGDLHDMVGWDEHARFVHDAWAALPDAERASCLLLGASYGHAGALDLLWPGATRPAVASNHLSWHLWSPPPGRWSTALALGRSRRWLDVLFESVEEVGRSPGHPQGLERDVPLWRCTRPRGELAGIWFARPFL